MIVVDTNIIAYLLIKGDFTGDAKKLLRLDQEWIAPILWNSEFRNVLTTYYRNNYFDLNQVKFLMNKSEELMKGAGYQVRSNDVIELSAISGCSAYDCEFIALAKDFGINLITTDKKLIKAFPEIAIHLKDYVR